MAKVGEHFGSIRIVGLLGAGGMGEVYEGYDETLQRKVALKTIRAERRLSDQAQARFLREARILSQLDHPNICRIHDFITQEQTDSLVLEFIDGRTLDKVQAEKPDFESRLDIALAIAEVLAAAHAEGIVHRDLKPGNVMLTPNGQVKVLDFGLARADEAQPQQVAQEPVESPTTDTARGSTATGSDMQATTIDPGDLTATFAGPGSPDLLTGHGRVVGTPAYMSPEQARGETIHTSSDMYSFGLLLQNLFTGKFPYPAGITAGELVTRATRGETLAVTGIGSDLTDLIDRLKSLAPAARPTAVEARARLEWIRDKPKRRLRRLAVAVVLALIAVGAVKYTVDLRRERTIAVEAQRVAEQRRGQAEDLIGFMLGDLRKKLEPLGQLEILDDVGSNAMSYFAAVEEGELSDDELSSRSRALYQIGEVRIAQGNLEAALAPLEESLSLARLLVERAPADGERLFEAGQSHFWVGFVHWRRGNLGAALEQFREYLNISERLVEIDPENPDWRLELAYSYSNIGSVLQAQGDLEQALERFRSVLAIDEELLAQAPDDADARLNVARSHNTVGFILECLGHFEEALEHYTSELAIKESLVVLEPSHAQWQYELAISRNYFGSLRVAMGDVDEGLSRFDTSIETLTRLTERDPTNSPWKRELAATLQVQGEAFEKTGRLAEAREALEASVALHEELVALDPTDIGWQRGLASSRTRLGSVLARSGDLDDAQEAALGAGRILERLAASNPENRDVRRWLTEAHVLRGVVSNLRGKPDRAEAEWTEAVELIGDLARTSSDRRFLEPWVRALLYLGRGEEARPSLERLSSFGYRNPELEQRWDALVAQAGAAPAGAAP